MDIDRSIEVARLAGRKWHYVGRWKGGRSHSRTVCGLPALRLNRPVGHNDWQYVTCGSCIRIAQMDDHDRCEHRPPAWMTAATEPCQTCKGYGRCPDCRVGRPILTIEVECDACESRFRDNLFPCHESWGTYRLTASEVLPVFGPSECYESPKHVCFTGSGETLLHLDMDGDEIRHAESETSFTLPPAATAGQFALIGEVV